jgi:hypothetical protein
MSEEVEGIVKGLEITGESPLDTLFSHKDIGTVNISRMEASIAAGDPIWYPMLCEWDLSLGGRPAAFDPQRPCPALKLKNLA